MQGSTAPAVCRGTCLWPLAPDALKPAALQACQTTHDAAHLNSQLHRKHMRVKAFTLVLAACLTSECRQVLGSANIKVL
jgi:hypothetical protein